MNDRIVSVQKLMHVCMMKLCESTCVAHLKLAHKSCDVTTHIATTHKDAFTVDSAISHYLLASFISSSYIIIVSSISIYWLFFLWNWQTCTYTNAFEALQYEPERQKLLVVPAYGF